MATRHGDFQARVEEIEPQRCIDPYLVHYGEDADAEARYEDEHGHALGPYEPIDYKYPLGTHHVVFGLVAIQHYWITPKPFGPLCKSCAEKAAKEWNSDAE